MNDEQASTMIAMGFDKELATRALSQANGDLELAIEKALSQDKDINTDLHYDYDIVSTQISQYSLDGRSACTCIALRAASDLLYLLSRADRSSDMKRLMTQECLESIIIKGCNDYHSLQKKRQSHLADDHIHMSAEDVLEAAHDSDVSYQITSTCDVRQGILNHPVIGIHQTLCDCHQESGLKNSSVWTAIVFTKVPETVCVLLPPLSSRDMNEQKFLLLDSHPRPSLGIHGGYALFFNSLDALTQKLSIIFPAVDLGNDDFMSQMYNAFDAYSFQMTPTTV